MTKKNIVVSRPADCSDTDEPSVEIEIRYYNKQGFMCKMRILKNWSDLEDYDGT